MIKIIEGTSGYLNKLDYFRGETGRYVDTHSVQSIENIYSRSSNWTLMLKSIKQIRNGERLDDELETLIAIRDLSGHDDLIGGDSLLGLLIGNVETKRRLVIKDIQQTQEAKDLNIPVKQGFHRILVFCPIREEWVLDGDTKLRVEDGIILQCPNEPNEETNYKVVEEYPHLLPAISTIGMLDMMESIYEAYNRSVPVPETQQI